MKQIFAALLVVISAFGCNAQNQKTENGKQYPVMKPDAEWRKQLTPLQFDVARKKGTERAYSGKYWDNHQAGTYYCICCDQPLFSSSTKFERGTGWPSFWQPLSAKNVEEIEDNSIGMERVEVN